MADKMAEEDDEKLLLSDACWLTEEDGKKRIPEMKNCWWRTEEGRKLRPGRISDGSIEGWRVKNWKWNFLNKYPNYKRMLYAYE